MRPGGGPDDLPRLDPYNPRGNFDDPDYPYPGDGPAGGGGGGYPGGDPAHNNFNQQGDANNRNNRGNNYILGNPFSDVIKAISDKIAEN